MQAAKTESLIAETVRKKRMRVGHESYLNPFQATVSFVYPLERKENLRVY